MELGEDLIPQMTVVNCLLSKQLDTAVKYIIVTTEKNNPVMGGKEVIKVISDIGKVVSYHQANNNYYYLISEERLPNLKRHVWVIEYQGNNSDYLLGGKKPLVQYLI